MKTYIRIFEGTTYDDLAGMANSWAEKTNEEIVSATLTIRSFDYTSDDAYLTVVFKRN